MRGLSVADQQMVDMAAALAQNARVLLMDEPTAALTPNEVDRLFAIMRQLRDQGVAIAFISHRLEEISAIADRITVMRDGEIVGQRFPKSTTHDELIRLMVGRSVQVLVEKPASPTFGAVRLAAHGLTAKGRFADISFALRAGEIVGMAGLVGAGRSDVAQALFGLTTLDSGQIEIDGQPVKFRNPRAAMAHGLAFVPEDRQHTGLLMPMSVTINATLPMLPQLATLGWLRPRRERADTQEYVEQLRIVLRSLAQPVAELSGGNQQKVVLSKWLMRQPRIMLLDEPTRGIDVGAKAEVHRLINGLAAQGIAILMISSELPEVLAMSDRVLVMREGRLVAELARSQLSAEAVMAAATGQKERRGDSRMTTIRATPTTSTPRTGWLKRALRTRELITLLLLLIVVFGMAAIQPRYLEPISLRSILLWIPLLAIIGMGEMTVIIIRGIDVSVGSIVGLAGLSVGLLFVICRSCPWRCVCC